MNFVTDKQERSDYLKVMTRKDYTPMNDWVNTQHVHGEGCWFNVMVCDKNGTLCIVQHSIEHGVPVHDQLALAPDDARELVASLNAYLLEDPLDDLVEELMKKPKLSDVELDSLCDELDKKERLSTAEQLEDPEVRRFVDQDHTRRGGTS